jgi:hypothetical protein
VTELPIQPCAQNYNPPAKYLAEEEVVIFKEVLGEEIKTIGKAALILFSNHQYQTPVYQRYVEKQMQGLWTRIQTNILICQGLILI